MTEEESPPFHRLAFPKMRIHLLPGGMMPERQTDSAVGYDARIRAVVSPFDMDPENSQLRKTLFDFERIPDDPEIARHVVGRPSGLHTELEYQMDPGESVLVGIGFVTAMPFPLFYWVAPRSGLASKHGITVTNAPGTVDPDYRGEAGALVYNRTNKSFRLSGGMRIVQIVFTWAAIPDFEVTTAYEELGSTKRSAGGFGSTGLT